MGFFVSTAYIRDRVRKVPFSGKDPARGCARDFSLGGANEQTTAETLIDI